MTSRCVNPECRQKRLRLAYLAAAGLAVLIAAGDHAGARSGQRERPIESIQSRSAGEPVMAIVSLRSQRITVYDAKGWILRAPVSSGTKGGEKSGRGANSRRDGLAGRHAGQGAGSRGGKSEAPSRGAIGGRRDQAWRRHLGGGKGAG